MKSWLRSRRFFMQALALSISLLLLLCIISVAMLYTNSQKSTKQTIFQIEKERSAELLRHVDSYLEQLITVGYSYVTLDLPNEQLTGGSGVYTQKILDTMLFSHIYANRNISNIEIESRNTHLYPSAVAHERELGTFYFYKILCEEETKWPYSFDLVAKDNRHPNKVTLTLEGYFLSRQIFSNQPGGRAEYLLLQDGTVLLTNQKTDFFANIQDCLPGIKLEVSSVAQQELGVYDDRYYVLSEPDKYGFRILSMVPQSIYESQYKTVTVQTVIMSAFLFLVAILASLFLAFRFYRPIKKTVDMLQTYIPDDLHEYENEIAYIYHNITKLKRPGEESLTQIQKAQTAVLQYQINSHFLFNTLENIKALSILALGMDNSIERSIMLLNTIIREGVFQKNLFVPLSHELHLSKCYLELMHLRFPDVEINWEVDESVFHCQVFKFSLQPILENCFAHAFQNNSDNAKRVSVTVKKNDHDFSIFVADNGSGINTESARDIEQLLQAPGETENTSHVGIYNVHKRIADTFGSDYGIRFTSDARGTVMELRYPLSAQGEYSN